MGKSIRSKIKRAHRANFRKGEGQVAADKAMAIIQENLKKNMKPDSEITAGNLGAVQSLFGTSAVDVDNDEHDANDMSDEDDASDKSPKKQFVQRKKSKLHPKPHMADTHGASLARRKVSKTNKRGQTKFGFKVAGKKVAPTKKKGKKKAVI